jgi:N-acetylglucosaminyldiphosphoundecaprenol N-acetyl-beta-D-mannosaminyltransferase
MNQRINVLGVGVNTVDMSAVLDTIDEWITRRERHYICVTGVHGIMESYRKKPIREIHNSAGLVVPDGMPLVWFGRLKGHHHIERVYGPDLMLSVCRRSRQRGHRHFLYGGAAGVVDKLAARLQARVPGLNIVGGYSPPFRPLNEDEDREVVGVINSSRADIVWVGISTPKQELWMAEHLGRLHAPVLIGVGAAFDFHAGLKSQAPRWMMRAGLEWVFRMLQEPRRLGPRYFANNPLFIALIFAQLLGLRFGRMNTAVSAASTSRARA